MRFKIGSSELTSLGLLSVCVGGAAHAQTTFEPLPPLPIVESLDTASPAPQAPSRPEPQQTPAKPVVLAAVENPVAPAALYEVPAKPARPVTAIAPPSLTPSPASFRRGDAPAQPAPGNLAPSKSADAMLATGLVAPQMGLSVPAIALVGAVRIGAATGGPSLRNVVPSDVGDVVFTSASDVEPANGWFTRTYRAALKRNGLLANKPELARYELTAEVRSMAITPLATGAHHRSVVTYRLRDIANGNEVWERTQTTNLEVQRGMRFGALGGALGAALGGALTGQNPAVTSQMISNQRGHRPFDVRIDVYEGIMRGFQEMARNSVAELTIPKVGQ